MKWISNRMQIGYLFYLSKELKDNQSMEAVGIQLLGKLQLFYLNCLTV